MSKEEAITVKDAVHKLQLHLLEGIEDEEKLFFAGSVLSRGDYHDVVTERSIANMCGYPLCKNALPLDRPKKGRYRISLKEHKVYDLQETYMYCSTGCVVNSLAFAGSIPEERSSELNPTKLNQVLSLFVKSSLIDSKDDMRVEDRKSGQRSDLRIKEKFDVKDSGEVSMEEWVGPSNAIDGYVPQRDQQHVKPEQIKKREKGTKPKNHQQLDNLSPVSFMDFTSTIIMTQDEYSVSKGPGLKKIASDDNTKDSKKVASNQQPAVSKKSRRALKKYDGPDIPPAKNVVSSQVLDLSNKMNDELMISDPASNVSPSTTFNDARRPESEINVANGVKSSLKHSSEKKNVTRSVTWADEKNDGSSSSQSLCTFNDGAESSSKISGLEESEADGRYASAEACALALSHAAEAVSSGSSDVSDAVAEAGIVILPPDEVDESEILEEEDDLLQTEQVRLKWPREPGLPDHNVLDSNDSLYDAPPEGFNLSLSPFATMFMALFSWISSSSLAYIYGHDGESFSEDNYSCINDREYPSKVVLSDGRSTEIKQALAGCLSRSLPGLITDLRIPMPVSTLEKELGHLLDTMTFIEALPPFRLKQWQLVILLFLDALSVCRIPELSRYITTGRRIWLPKIMEGARISGEEFEMLKDLLIPLGRVPQFASQSGG